MTCEMITKPGGYVHTDEECGLPAVATCQDVPVCEACANAMRAEGFEVVNNPPAPASTSP